SLLKDLREKFTGLTSNNIQLWIDLGEDKVQSAAQLGYNHSINDVEGLKVLCVTDLGEVKITDFRSEVLTLGVPDKDGNPVLVTPEIDMPKGKEN
ncbi:tRNA-binding protein, partial [Candidatus Haloredivivus sp. G17]